MKRNSSLKQSIITSSIFTLILWLILIFENIFFLRLDFLAVLPLDKQGALGIITAPLIHGGPAHLFSNSLPLIILGTMLLYGYKNIRWRVLTTIWLISGIGVWLFARDAYHLGASGITHGIFFFLLVASIIRRDLKSIALMLVAFFMYGSMIMSVLPSDPTISFEYHLFGAIGGLVAAKYFAKYEPNQDKKYEWENEGLDEQTNSYLNQDDYKESYKDDRSKRDYD